ncbi:MAG: hypothetical protein LBR26_05885 [Prevotella sp.]|jgi:hypothetical protein|nr:hypothetical protein [Prevotella sp.]
MAYKEVLETKIPAVITERYRLYMEDSLCADYKDMDEAARILFSILKTTGTGK